MNKLNKEAFDLIKYYEGLRLNAYLDTGGVWTIGYGHTAKAGAPSPKSGMKISKAEAERIFLRDLVKFENAVKRIVKVPLNDNQYGALVSLCYNLGEGNFGKSTLVRLLNSRDYNGAANQFGKWVYDNGVKLNGLIKRRKAEADLFRKGSLSAPAKSYAAEGGSTDNWFIRLLKMIFRGGK